MKHLKEFVKSVPDYRRTDKGNYKHKLEDILLLVILGRLGKCITRPDIIRFGERNLKRFRSLGILLEGVPSEPTLCRVFKHIDDEAMSGRMSEFTAAFHCGFHADCYLQRKEPGRKSGNEDNIKRILLYQEHVLLWHETAHGRTAEEGYNTFS